jgi:hypothetical protein
MPSSGAAGAATGGSGSAGVASSVSSGGTAVAAGGMTSSGLGGSSSGAGNASSGGSANATATGGTGDLSAGGSIAGRGTSGTGGVGGGDGGSGDSAGEGQAGGSDSIQSTGLCTCDWWAPSCTSGENLYAGKQCPPTLEEAGRVASWPLGGPPASGATQRTAEYEECDDGTRSFMVSFCGGYDEFVFDPEGYLRGWSQTAKYCASSTRSSDPTPTASCSICTMTSDPPGEGMSCFPRGLSNGPSPSCMIDANGRWLMPPLCDS